MWLWEKRELLLKLEKSDAEDNSFNLLINRINCFWSSVVVGENVDGIEKKKGNKQEIISWRFSLAVDQIANE